MISFDKAKRLKGLNLEWNPKVGDLYKPKYSHNPFIFSLDTLTLDNTEIKIILQTIKEDENNIWFPSLDQLLDEIEKRNFMWTTHYVNFNKCKYLCVIYEILNNGMLSMDDERFHGDTKEDSVADALTWILENNKI